jgi:hypothetical protein
MPFCHNCGAKVNETAKFCTDCGAKLKDKLDDIEEQLKLLLWIGITKNSFPFRLRGWVGELGLFVQFRSIGDWGVLKAGGKLRSCLHAECILLDESIPHTACEIKKFDRKRWGRNFAHLVEPTYEIARFFDDRSEEGISEQDAAALKRAIRHFKKTGEWLGLPRKSSV